MGVQDDGSGVSGFRVSGPKPKTLIGFRALGLCVWAAVLFASCHRGCETDSIASKICLFVGVIWVPLRVGGGVL